MSIKILPCCLLLFFMANSAFAANGVCGLDNGKVMSSMPVNLCAIGNPTPIPSLGGPWFWSCLGTEGGETVYCSAKNTIVVANGLCGFVNEKSFTSKPLENLCTWGSVVAFTEEQDKWRWICLGDKINDECSANKIVTSELKVENGSTCSDTDNGKDYFSKGKTEWVKVKSFEISDSCSNDGKVLFEQYCVSSKEKGDYSDSVSFVCPKGCKDGACIKTTRMELVEKIKELIRILKKV